MGIGYVNASLIVQTAKRYCFHGTMLQLGRQNVHLTPEEFMRMLLDEGFAHFDGQYFVPKYDLNTLICERHFFRTDLDCGNFAESFLNDQLFFAALGINAFSCDISPEEHPDYIADLNEDLKKIVEKEFDIVYNGGTLEHVFDPAHVLRNMHNILKPRGYAIHIIPVNGYVNHGFYQLSPLLLDRFYRENGYDVLESKYIIRTKSRTFVCEYLNAPPPIEGHQILLYFVARKPDSHSKLINPQQKPDTHFSDYFNFTAFRHEMQIDHYLKSNPNANIVIWSGGSYADYFMSRHAKLADITRFVVDADPAKQGTTIFGKQVVSPAECYARRDEFDAIAILTPNSISLRKSICSFPELRNKKLIF